MIFMFDVGLYPEFLREQRVMDQRRRSHMLIHHLRASATRAREMSADMYTPSSIGGDNTVLSGNTSLQESCCKDNGLLRGRQAQEG